MPTGPSGPPRPSLAIRGDPVIGSSRQTRDRMTHELLRVGAAIFRGTCAVAAALFEPTARQLW